MGLARVVDPVPAQETPPIGRFLRRLVAAVLAIGAVTVLWANRADVPVAASSIRHARPSYLLLALALVVLGFVNHAALHASAQRAAGLDTRASELFTPAAAATFFNVVAKSGGMAGLTPLLRASSERRRSRGATTAAFVLVTVIGHLAFAATLVAGLVILWFDRRFTPVDAVASVAFATTAGMQMLAIVAATRSREGLRRLVSLPQRMRNWVRRAGTKRPLDPTHADELFEAVQLVRRNPRLVLAPVGYALVVEIIGIAQLWCVLQALDAGPSVGMAIAAYAISVLFLIIGFLPGGLGVVEASLGALLISFSLPRATAAAAVVLYRICELWIPLLAGAAAAHKTMGPPVR